MELLLIADRSLHMGCIWLPLAYQGEDGRLTIAGKRV
jgi:hypothetical protein